MITEDAFKSAMRRLPAQVCAISSTVGDLRIAMTATAVTSLSASPPQLLVCIHEQSRSAALIREADGFVVNFLSTEQQDVANQCARPGLEPEERFEIGNWAKGETGMPILLDAEVSLECRLQSVYQEGTHLICVGLICAICQNEAEPLLYHDTIYKTCAPLDAPEVAEWDSSLLGF